ncbi:MAG: MobA/MobL protein, partial [Caulobacteraceae bacterium]|nr:MobA/MobL protein [Caulobacteraceae bacterium]
SLRADRFVGDWKSLSAQRDALKGWEHTEVRQAVETRMEAMAQGLGRDAVLNGRRKELGLELDKRLERGRDLPAELTGTLSRSLGLGLSR